MTCIRFSRAIMVAACVVAASIAGPSSAAQEAPAPIGSSQTACTDNLVVIVPASAQTVPGIPEQVPHGGATAGLGLRLAATAPNTSVATVAYNSMWPTQTISYNNSVKAGVEAAEALIARHHAQCPSQKVHLFGYSEGADVAGSIASHIGAGTGPIDKDLLASAALMANPSRNTTVAQAGTAGNGAGFHPGYDYGAVSDKVLEICNAGDAVCNADDAFPLLNANLTDPILDSSIFGGPWHPEALPAVADTYSPQHWPQLPGEFSRLATGWGIHIGSYILPGGGLDAGEVFIRDHLV